MQDLTRRGFFSPLHHDVPSVSFLKIITYEWASSFLISTCGGFCPVPQGGQGKVISTFLFQINEKENPSGDHKGGENLAHGEWA